MTFPKHLEWVMAELDDLEVVCESDDVLREVGLDSLGLVSLLLTISEQFEFDLADNEEFDWSTPISIAEGIDHELARINR